MSTNDLDGGACALFLVTAFSLAGLCQAAWLGSGAARGWAWPLDGGRTWRGRRIFGPNKTARGFVVMLPAAMASFVLVGQLPPDDGGGVWNLTPAGFAGLGLLAATGFMTGELPNSFLKRQLGIAPGHPPERGWARVAFGVLDRIDSVLGLLAALALAVPVPFLTVVYLLTAGPLVHGLFSVLTFRLGGKARAA